MDITQPIDTTSEDDTSSITAANSGAIATSTADQSIPERNTPTLVERIDQLLCTADVLMRLKLFVNGDIPHLLLHGTPGTGKTTAAQVIGKYFYSSWLDVAKEKTDINGVRRLAQFFRDTALCMDCDEICLRCQQPKLMVLDEADCLSRAAQKVLCTVMESNGPFIIIGNDIDKFIWELQERCAVISFGDPNDAALKQQHKVLLTKIVAAEGGGVEPAQISEWVETHFPDFRQPLELARLEMKLKRVAKANAGAAHDADETGSSGHSDQHNPQELGGLPEFPRITPAISSDDAPRHGDGGVDSVMIEAPPIRDEQIGPRARTTPRNEFVGPRGEPLEVSDPGNPTSSPSAPRTGTQVRVADTQPMPAPTLIDDIAAEIGRYVILPPGGVDAMALFVLHTHTHDAARHSPLLTVTSPVKECGKTTTFDVLLRLVARPRITSNGTPAALVRLAAAKHTLLLDEQDTAKQVLVNFLNAGHSRIAPFFDRMEGGQCRQYDDGHRRRSLASATCQKLSPVVQSNSDYGESRKPNLWSRSTTMPREGSKLSGFGWSSGRRII